KIIYNLCIFFFQAEDGIRDRNVTGVQTCALPISVYERINHDPNRPNANGKSLEDLKSLYSKRESSYNDIAFIHIDADRPKEVVVTEIINSLDKDIFANDQS